MRNTLDEYMYFASLLRLHCSLPCALVLFAAVSQCALSIAAVCLDIQCSANANPAVALPAYAVWSSAKQNLLPPFGMRLCSFLTPAWRLILSLSGYKL